MAIEFNCPYCTATIRVPDGFAGKQGKCPKCETRLLVPNVEIPDEEPSQSSDGPETNAFGADTMSGLSAEGPTTVGIHAVESAGSVPEFIPTTPQTNITSKLKRRTRRGRNRIWTVAVPVIGFLLLLSLLAMFTLYSLPQLKGTLAAEVFSEPTVPRVTFPWSSTGLSTEEQEQLSKILEHAPEGFVSELMTCRLIADEKGLQVQLTAGEGHSWFVVDPTQSRALVLWAEKQQQYLSITRASEMKRRLADYCQDKIKQQAGEIFTIDAQQYRDSVGINTHVSALGYALEAFGSGRIVPCGHEDQQGRLYFLLPSKTRSFIMRGRMVGDGTKPFPGEYTIQVGDRILQEDIRTVPVEPESEASSDGPEPEDSSEQPMDAAMDKDDQSPMKQPGDSPAGMETKAGTMMEK
ncbi:MAG: hypothetical protein R3C20_04665 [Planctomycetaceae bacterium]